MRGDRESNLLSIVPDYINKEELLYWRILNLNKALLILGAGQYGMVAKEIAESMNCFEKIDFLDDNSDMAIGKLNSYQEHHITYQHAIVAIGNPEIRLSYIQKLSEVGYEIVILISPYAYISPSAQIKKGSIVEAMAVVNTHAKIEAGVILCAGTIVNHDCLIGEGCLLQCGSVTVANSVVKSKTTLNYNEVYDNKGVYQKSQPPQENHHKF